jgi:hypothetical protein
MGQAMRRLDAHGKFPTVPFGVLLSCSLLLLSGCGGGLLPQQQAQTSLPFQSYYQVVASFDQIVPGMTRADDLPHLGFDARTGNADVLSYLGHAGTLSARRGRALGTSQSRCTGLHSCRALLHRLGLPSWARHKQAYRQHRG